MVRSADGESAFILAHNDEDQRLSGCAVRSQELGEAQNNHNQGCPGVQRGSAEGRQHSGVGDAFKSHGRQWRHINLARLDPPPGGGVGVALPPGVPGAPPGGGAIPGGSAGCSSSGGGIGGPPGPKPPGQKMSDFQIFLIGSDGVEKATMDLGAEKHLTNGGYLKFDPENKKLFTSSYRDAGLDMYEVTDPTAANGLKLKTAIRTARLVEFKGHFFMSPEGKYLVFQDGPVIETSNVGGAAWQTRHGAATEPGTRITAGTATRSGSASGTRTAAGSRSATNAGNAAESRISNAADDNHARPIGSRATAQAASWNVTKYDTPGSRTISGASWRTAAPNVCRSNKKRSGEPRAFFVAFTSRTYFTSGSVSRKR